MEVLIISDMLNDFILENGPLYCGPGSKGIIPVIKKMADRCRKKGGKVIYLCDAHDRDDKEFRMWKSHAVKGTPGARVVDELRPERSDIVVEKKTYSAFYGTKLEKVLKKIKPGEITVAGVCASICVMEAVGELRVRGYNVIVRKNAIADFDEEAHQFALKKMVSVYGAKVV